MTFAKHAREVALTSVCKIHQNNEDLCTNESFQGRTKAGQVEGDEKNFKITSFVALSIKSMERSSVTSELLAIEDTQ